MKGESLDSILGVFKYTEKELQAIADGGCIMECTGCELRRLCNDSTPLEQWAKGELERHFGVKP